MSRGMRGLLAVAIALALLLSPMLTAPALAAPTADPGVPWVGELGVKALFDGTGSIPDDEDINRWYWDYGDGTKIDEKKKGTTSHTYEAVGVYTVRLQVKDKAGTLSSWASTTATILDNTPPTVSITQPAANSTVSGIVTVTAATSDDRFVSQVEFRVDGSSIGSDPSSPWSVDWDTNDTTNGPHTLTAIATDALNRSSERSVVVTVSNLALPSVSITEPLDGAVVEGTVAITASAADATSYVEFFVDNGRIGTDFFGSNGWSTNWNTTTGADGDHTVSVVAHDRQGRTSTDAINVTVQNTPTTTTTSTTTTTTTTSPTTTSTTSTSTTVPTTTSTTADTTTTTTETTTTSGPPPSTTVTIDATTTTLDVLGRRIEATTKARGVSATSFEVTPLTWSPGEEITLIFALEATVPGFSTVLFVLDGDPLGAPAQVTTGTEMTFTRVLPSDLPVGSHRIELVADEDPPRVLASRTVGVAASAAGQAAQSPPITPAATAQNPSLLPVVGVLFLAAIAAVTWRNRHRWIPRRTRT